MDIDSTVASTISIPIQIVAIFLVNIYLLNYKITKKDLGLITLFCVIPTILLFPFVGLFATFYLLLSMIIFFMRRHSIIFSLLHIFVSFIMAVAADHVASLIGFQLFGSISSEVLFFLLRGILFCLLLGLTAYIYKQLTTFFTRKNLFNRRMLYLFIAILFLTLVFFYVNISMISDNTSYESIQLNLWIFTVYIALICIIAAAIVHLSIKQYKIRAKEKEQENFSNYIQLLEQTNENTRKFKHDYINILISLRYYIEKEDMEALKTYFFNTLLPTQQKEMDQSGMLDELNKLKIDGIKGLLTTKVIHAQESGIPVHLEVLEDISQIDLDIIELNRILGILLDNAIEASKNLEDPLIRIGFIKMEHSIMIVILNRIPEDIQLSVQDVFQEGFSTKGKNRGLGLPYLKEVVNANNHIVLNTKIENSYFIQELEI